MRTPVAAAAVGVLAVALVCGGAQNASALLDERENGGGGVEQVPPPLRREPPAPVAGGVAVAAAASPNDTPLPEAEATPTPLPARGDASGGNNGDGGTTGGGSAGEPQPAAAPGVTANGGNVSTYSPEFRLSPLRRDDLISKLSRAEFFRQVPEQAREGVEMTETWAAKSKEFQSQNATNGSVVLTFNASLPTIVAAVLKLTDVELQAGENVTSVNLGDQARWTVSLTNSNDGELQRPHLIIKPLDENLQTSMVVTTSRRTYHFFLQSNLERFMHHVTFQYPEDPEEEALRRRRAEEEATLRSKMQRTEAVTIAATTARLPRPVLPGPPDRSVAYRVEGEAPWQPLYAYTDGRKTYIQMPASMSQTEAPSLLALRRGKGLVGGGEGARQLPRPAQPLHRGFGVGPRRHGHRPGQGHADQEGAPATRGDEDLLHDDEARHRGHPHHHRDDSWQVTPPP